MKAEVQKKNSRKIWCPHLWLFPKARLEIDLLWSSLARPNFHKSRIHLFHPHPLHSWPLMLLRKLSWNELQRASSTKRSGCFITYDPWCCTPLYKPNLGNFSPFVDLDRAKLFQLSDFLFIFCLLAVNRKGHLDCGDSVGWYRHHILMTN